MKRHAVERLLRKNGCIVFREGGRHTVWYNSATGKTSTVPRHAEINDDLVRKICNDLGIPQA